MRGLCLGMILVAAGCGESRYRFDVTVVGHGSVTIGETFSCAEERCETTIEGEHPYVAVTPEEPEWITTTVTLDGAPPENPTFGNATTVFETALGDHSIEVTFSPLEACTPVADLAGPPIIQRVPLEACVDGWIGLTGIDLASPMVVGDGVESGVCGYVGTQATPAGAGGGTTMVGIMVPPGTPLGPSWVSVRTVDGRDTAVTNIVDLPSPAPTGVSPSTVSIGETVTIRGTNLDHIIQLTIAGGVPWQALVATVAPQSATSHTFTIDLGPPNGLYPGTYEVSVQTACDYVAVPGTFVLE